MSAVPDDPGFMKGYGKPTRQGEHVLTVIDELIRCGRCNALLAEMAARPWIIKCRRCKIRNHSPEPR